MKTDPFREYLCTGRTGRREKGICMNTAIGLQAKLMDKSRRSIWLIQLFRILRKNYDRRSSISGRFLLRGKDEKSQSQETELKKAKSFSQNCSTIIRKCI